MSVSVTRDGPYFSSGSISFSDLRLRFKETTSGSVSASELRRNTSIDEANAIVPDSTENEKISTGSNLSLSQFRNSIKRYYATQSGTDHNSSYPNEPGFRMGRYDPNGRGIDWSGGGYYGRDGQGGGTSGNLTKNIQKIIYITGVCGSYYTNMPGAQMAPEPSLINIRFNISGAIYGAGGQGGYPLGNNGGGTGFDGGIALNINFNATQLSRNLVVNIESNGRLYGGGGGGGKGRNGLNGSSGTCASYSYYSYSSCGGGNRCPNGGNVINRNNSGGNDCRCGGKGGCKEKTYRNDCEVITYYSVPGAPGGIGGNGGNGQGYNQSRSNGEAGAAGTPGGCPTYGGSGENGRNGGNGGDWGQNGQAGGGRSDIGGWPGGRTGAAINITANNYKLIGSVNSTTCKGPVNA